MNILELPNEWYNNVKGALENIQQVYSKNRGMILTEGDLECMLYSELVRFESFGKYYASKDTTKFIESEGAEFKTGYVHSQVTWFKENEQSGFEVDITIANPSLLEVSTIEIFERWPHKGFAYDGPCIAVELKFIRTDEKVTRLSTEDYIKLRDRLIPAKLENISKGVYKNSSTNNILFITVVGCKTKNIYDEAISNIQSEIDKKSRPPQLKVVVFCQDKIVWL